MADNQNNFISIAKKIANSLGLDVIPYAVGLDKFKTDAPFQPTKLNEIESQVDTLTGKKIDDALSYCKEMLDIENERGNKIENKASNLIGVTGISTAFVTGVTSLISDKTVPILFWLIPVLYVFIVLSLTLTVLLASRVVIVGEYRYAYPDISDVFDMGSQDLDKTKKDRLASYLYCYAKNFQIHNIKASYLIGSQVWFRNAIILFLFLALTLALSVAQNVKTAAISPADFPSMTLTITPTSFTSSPQPTLIVPSNPGKILTNTPTFEPTMHKPLPTIQPSPTYTPKTSNQTTSPITP